MQSFLKVLTVVIFVVSTLCFGLSLMFAYQKSGPYDPAKKLAEMKTKNSTEAAKLKELTEARANAKETDQGIEYFESELGKSKNANERRETKEYPEMQLQLANAFGVDRARLEKTEEDNLKAGERTLAEKQRSLKELRGKVQAANVERNKAKADIESLEAQKKELLNRTAQSAIALDDARNRHDEVAKQLDAAKKASTGASP